MATIWPEGHQILGVKPIQGEWKEGTIDLSRVVMGTCNEKLF
jgi:hypothetical protein